VRQALEDSEVAGDVVDTVELLTSEVITNALVHAQSAPQLAVRVQPPVVRVEVVDGSPVIPIRRTIEAESLSGRGIAIVETLASDWGVTDISPDGKTVWFEVAI
jgi:anti-sigma regulatory factor (Ser/Thr protein kinase)